MLDGHKAAMDRMTAERGRPMLEGKAGSAADGEYKTAFSAYVKRGEEKALQIGVGADGGYVVPPEVDTEITRLMTQISPIRAIAGVRQVSSAVYKRPITVTGPQTGWVGEAAARPTTTSQTLAELSYPTAELYAMPAATSAFLDERGGCRRLDRRRGQCGLRGAGNHGLRDRQRHQQADRLPRRADRGRDELELGEPGLCAHGTAGALPTDQPLRRADRPRLCAQGRLPAERHLGDEPPHAGGAAQAQGCRWQLSLAAAASADGRASLLGFPLVEAEDMPSIGANSLSIAFGDFRRGYLVVDRQGVSVLRDPFSAKPYVLFYTTKRVGGGVADFDAIKLLKFGTS